MKKFKKFLFLIINHNYFIDKIKIGKIFINLITMKQNIE